MPSALSAPRFRLCVFALLGASCLLPSRTGAQHTDARAVLDSAFASIGGKARWSEVQTSNVTSISRWVLREQSERYEGPWISTFDRTQELRSFRKPRLRQTSENIGATDAGPPSATLIVSNGVAALNRQGQVFPFTQAQVEDAEESLALGPERVLFSAADAADLRLLADTVLFGSPHRVLAFTWRGAPVRLFIAHPAHVLGAVEIVRASAFDAFWYPWGDVRTRTFYSNWSLEPSGLWYPRQWSIERNGAAYRDLSILSVGLSTAPSPEDSFHIAPDIEASFAVRGRRMLDSLPLGRPDQPISELQPGVVLLPGRWNVLVVRQQDGVVVLEAPLSNGYSAKVLAEVARRFPGQRIKAVVTTSNAWPHVGGLREYIARGIPVYASAGNRALLGALLSTPREFSSDSLSRSTRRPHITWIDGATSIGSGQNRLVIYPVLGSAAERMLMVQVVSARLLWGSDLVQPFPSGAGTPDAPQFANVGYLAELYRAVVRANIDIDTVVAMHAGATSWTVIRRVVENASGRTGGK